MLTRRLAVEALEDRRMLSTVLLGSGNEPFVVVDPFNPLNVVVGGNDLGDSVRRGRLARGRIHTAADDLSARFADGMSFGCSPSTASADRESDQDFRRTSRGAR